MYSVFIGNIIFVIIGAILGLLPVLFLTGYEMGKTDKFLEKHLRGFKDENEL